MAAELAVVGLAVRAPGGVAGLDAYWSAIMRAADLIGELPADRRERFGAEWDGMVTRGGYLHAPFDFDAKFFGISPKEARVLDPQSRLLLEVAWEAFEDAAVPPASVAASTGVFVGVTGVDYRQWLTGEPNSSWTIGTGHSFTAGRIAYTLGFGGPAFALDTACSSSLVAVHQAGRALATGECDVAVAGGVNLILAPGTTRSVAATGALSPGGHSRPFDADADGFVRGEGCGMLVLKRLADARRDQDRIYAVLAGTGINHDGHTPTFTAPNLAAQARLIERVLGGAGLTAADVGYHEAHGTGTPLGDPAEMTAVISALGRRDGPPLRVGSVKGNTGHTESAAGALGLIKAVLALRHRTVPPQAGFRRLNPRIDLTGTGIEIPVEPLPWDDRHGPCASASSYGMSGTNAFAVLSPAPPRDPAPGAAAGEGFLVSAATPAALADLARRYADHLAEASFGEFVSTVNTGRTRLKIAVWVRSGDPTSAMAALTALAAGESTSAVRLLDADEPPPGPPPQRVVTTLPTYPWQRTTHVPTG